MSAAYSPSPPLKNNPVVQTGINYVVISLMMVCASGVILELIRRLDPSWQGDYLLALTFLVSLEALLSHRMAQSFNFPSLEWMLHRLSEWVVIVVVVKLLNYLFTGPSQLLVDFNLWQQDFINSFFTSQFTILCAYLFLIWLFSTLFGDYLLKLETDLEVLELERQGLARSDRTSNRQSLMSLIFTIGAVLLMITAVVHIDLPFYNAPFEYRPFSAILLLLYFLLGFVLLAQSQYSILRARWYLQNIPMSHEITRRWAPFSFLMLAAILAVVFFLPTQYSRGFLDVLESVILIITRAIYTIVTLIVSLLLALLANLTGGSSPPIQAQPTPEPAPQLPITQAVPTHPAAWLELLQNLLFWIIFVAIIFFAFRYYFSQRQGVWQAIRRLPVWSLFNRAWQWLRSLARRLNRSLSAVVESGVARLRTLTRRGNQEFDPLIAISRRLPPRQRVLLIYLAMVHWNNHNGIYRKGSETPNEYARSLRRLIPDAEPDINLLTSSFMEARYTRHDISGDQAAHMQTAWEHFRESLQNYLDLQKQLQNQA